MHIFSHFQPLLWPASGVERCHVATQSSAETQMSELPPSGAGLQSKPTVEFEDGITQIRSRWGSTQGSKNKDLDRGGKATVVLSFDPPIRKCKVAPL